MLRGRRAGGRDPAPPPLAHLPLDPTAPLELRAAPPPPHYWLATTQEPASIGRIGAESASHWPSVLPVCLTERRETGRRAGGQGEEEPALIGQSSVRRARPIGGADTRHTEGAGQAPEPEFPLAEPPAGPKERDVERIRTGAGAAAAAAAAEGPAVPRGAGGRAGRTASRIASRTASRVASPPSPRRRPLAGRCNSEAHRGAAARGAGGPCGGRPRVPEEAGKGPRAAEGRPAAAPWPASEEPGCFRSPGPVFRR